MDLNLKGKVIIVPGGSKGIGLAISKVLAAEGAIPYIMERNRPNIIGVAKEIEKSGAQIGFAFAELTDPKQCKKAIEEAISRFGRIDGLVNNAGVNDGVGLENGN